MHRFRTIPAARGALDLLNRSVYGAHWVGVRRELNVLKRLFASSFPGFFRSVSSGNVDNIVRAYRNRPMDIVSEAWNVIKQMDRTSRKFKDAHKSLRAMKDYVDPNYFSAYAAVMVRDWDTYWNCIIGRTRAARISSELKQLVAKMLDPDPARRPSFADLLRTDVWTRNGNVYTPRDAVTCLTNGTENPHGSGGARTTRSLRSTAADRSTTRSLKPSTGLVPVKPFHLPDGVESVDENDLTATYIALPYRCNVAECWTSALKALDILGHDVYGAESFRFVSGGPTHTDCYDALTSCTVDGDPVVARLRCVSMKSDKKRCAILFRRVYGSALEFRSFFVAAEEAITGQRSPLRTAEEEDNGGDDALFENAGSTAPTLVNSRSLTSSRSLRPTMSSSMGTAPRSLRPSSDAASRSLRPSP